MSVNRMTPLNNQRHMGGRLFLRDDQLELGAELILAASRALMKDARPYIERQRLNSTEFDVLMEVRRSRGIDVASLRERLGTAKPTLARVLSDLDKAGLLERTRHPHDGRRRAIKITADGEKALEGVLRVLRENVGRAYRKAGETQVAGALALLSAILSEE